MKARTPSKTPRPNGKRRGVAARPVRTTSRIIADEAGLRAGIAALRRTCPHLRKAHDLAGDPPLRREPGGFAGLARIICAQQLSVASANAIWTRFAAAVTPMSPAGLARCSDADIRGVGMSRPKVKTLRAIVAAVEAGLDLDALVDVAEAEARAALTAIPGIGPWTADIYLMFCLGRADVFAPGDLALQVAAELAMGLDARPSTKEMADIAERWRPWRAVAARILWTYYRAARSAKSGAPV